MSLKNKLVNFAAIAVLLLTFIGIATGWTYTTPPDVECVNGTDAGCKIGNTKWNSTDVVTDFLKGDASNLTAVPAAQLTGTAPLAAIPATLTGKDADTVDGYHLNQNVSTGASPTFVTVNANVSASNITTGTLADARLSNNISKMVVAPNSLQTAINDGSSRVVAVGTFTLTTPLSLPSNFELDMTQATIIAPTTSEAMNNSGSTNITIRGGHIFARNQTTYSGIYLNSISNSKVVNVRIVGAYRGLTLNGSSKNNHVTSNIVVDDADRAIVIQDTARGCNNNIITNNIILNASDGMNIYGSRCNIISGNLINYTRHFGIATESGAGDNVISNNNIRDTDREAIWLQGSRYSVVSGNIVDTVRNDIGIDLDSTNNTIVTGNYINYTDKTCIAVANSLSMTLDNISITNNVGRGCGGYPGESAGKDGRGISAGDLINSTITGNMFFAGNDSYKDWTILLGANSTGNRINNNRGFGYTTPSQIPVAKDRSYVVENDGYGNAGGFYAPDSGGVYWNFGMNITRDPATGDIGIYPQAGAKLYINGTGQVCKYANNTLYAC